MAVDKSNNNQNNISFSNDYSEYQEPFPTCACFGGGNNNNNNNNNNNETNMATMVRKVVSCNDEYDAELAREMNQLSFKEREQILDDIHGVGKVHEETPEFVMEAIKELDLALLSVPKPKRRALDRAIFLKPSIEHDVKFKLMFLRADCYDASKAAKRLAKYFEDKLEMFGEDKLAKDITLEDLSEEDMQVFNTGWCLELPHKDQVGRPIWFFDITPTRCDFSRPDSLIRCAWYMVMVSLQDETAQIKGACNVSYAPGNIFALVSSMVKFTGLVSKVGDVLINLPMRITSYHYCYNDTRTKFMLSLIRNFFGKYVRLRVKTHFGSDLEMQYSLTTYGVPCKELLQQDDDDDNSLKVLLHKKYILRRREAERQQEETRKQQELATRKMLYPQPTDVLIGRGRPYYSFTGSVRFASLLDKHLDEYHACTGRFAKTCISMDVVKTIHEYGGRFIERTDAGWNVIDDVMAREKTAVGFRSRVSKVSPGVKKVQQQNQRNIPDVGMKKQARKWEDPMSAAKRLRLQQPCITLY